MALPKFALLGRTLYSISVAESKAPRPATPAPEVKAHIHHIRAAFQWRFLPIPHKHAGNVRRQLDVPGAFQAVKAEVKANETVRMGRADNELWQLPRQRRDANRAESRRIRSDACNAGVKIKGSPIRAGVNR